MINMNSSIKIKTDAFDLIIETCLSQQVDDKWHSAAYFLRKLLLTEQNYDIYDKKLLIIIATLKYWEVYAKGASSFDIYMNYKNLLQSIIIKELNRRQIRWAKELKQYKFKIHYTFKKKNNRADALNKRCDYIIIKKKFDRSILKINDDEIILTNYHQVNVILRIIKNDQKQFFISKEKL